MLIEAFAESSKKLRNATLVIAGRPWIPWEPYQQQIQQLGIGDKTKLLLDYISSEQVQQCFEASDLVVLPYKTFDAQSAAANVAIAFQKPLIVTRVGGLPELVSEKQAVVEPNDAKALSQAITSALSNKALRDRLAQHAKRLSKERDWDTIARKTVSLYESVLKTVPG